jgi:hypothetical protein
VSDSAIFRGIVKSHYERRAHEEALGRIAGCLEQLIEGNRRHGQEVNGLKDEVRNLRREVATFRTDFEAALPDEDEDD